MRLAMTIFLILVPYAAFAALMLLTSATTALFASSAICLAIVVFDVINGRSIKILGAGSAIVFAGLGAWLVFVDAALSNPAIKLAADIGVFTISLASLALRYPFTLQYALEIVDAETAKLPGFMKANYLITGAWSVAFLLMMIANMLMIYVPGLPLWSSLLIAFAARNSAVYFTKWYPAYRKTKYGVPAASSSALAGS
jgi:hypothetical protein